MHKEDKMDIFGILTLIGGLALFLYGMDVMGFCVSYQRIQS